MPVTAQTQPDWPEGVTLLLGIGAQKAGTSWLHAYLRGHPACSTGPMKELHYFDSLKSEGRLGRRLHAEALEKARDKGAAAGRIKRLERLRAICEAPDPDHQSYLNLIGHKLRPGQVAVDITPEYALVSDEVFRQMAALPNARMIFIMREPVARFWSAVRMRAGKRSDAAEFEEAAQALLDTMLAEGKGGAHRRSDYALTLDKLQRHVPEDRRLVLFFEELFTQQTADRICAFLGIAPRPMDDLGARNEGQKATMRPDQVARLTEAMRPQYEAVTRMFGMDVPRNWHARFAAGEVAA